MSGRIRTIKPEMLEDALTAGLSDTAFRLFIGLILLADDYGRMRAEEAYLLGQVFWKREPGIPISEALAELTLRRPSGKSLVVLYEVDDQTYGAITSWEKHQKISHRGKPRIPAPCTTTEQPSGDSPEGLQKVSATAPEILRPDLRPATSDQRPATTREEGDPPADSEPEKRPHPDPELAEVFKGAMAEAGHPVAVDRFAYRELSEAAAVHWPSLPPRARRGAMRDAVRAWVVVADEFTRGPKGAWSPKLFVKWLNAGNARAPDPAEDRGSDGLTSKERRARQVILDREFREARRANGDA